MLIEIIMWTGIILFGLFFIAMIMLGIAMYFAEPMPEELEDFEEKLSENQDKYNEL